MLTKPTTLREMRQRLGLTQMHLAVKADIGIVTVNAAEVSNTWPKMPKTRRRMAQALGLAADPVTGVPFQVTP